MPSFNKVFLIGNLTRDVQIKQLPSQTTAAEFGMAINRRYRTAAGEEREEVCYVDCTAFGKQAETIAQWCQKGKLLMVEGRLKFDTWEDKVGGAKRSKISVVVEGFQFLGARDDWGEQRTAQPAQRQQSQRTGNGSAPPRQSAGGGRPPAREQVEPPFGDEQQFQEADIPFAWIGRDSTPL